MNILNNIDLLYEADQNKVVLQQNELHFQKLKVALQQKGIELDDIEDEINEFTRSISLLYCKAGLKMGCMMFSEGYYDV